MEKGLVSKILDYYLTSREFRQEIDRAFREFFHIINADQLTGITMKAGESAHFQEWLLYDFLLMDGKTLLQNFYDQNPYNWTEEKIKVSRDLQTNEYGIYEVLRVNIGKGLKIKNLQSSNIYDVKERKATFQLRQRDLFFGRAAKVEDHWELVGANSFVIPLIFTERAKKFLSKTKDRLTPQIIVDIFGKYL